MKWKIESEIRIRFLRIKQTLQDKDPVGHRISCRISQLSIRLRANRTGESGMVLNYRSTKQFKITKWKFLLFLVAIFKSGKWCSSTIAKKFNSKTSRFSWRSNWFVDFEFEHLTIDHTFKYCTITLKIATISDKSLIFKKIVIGKNWTRDVLNTVLISSICGSIEFWSRLKVFWSRGDDWPPGVLYVSIVIIAWIKFSNICQAQKRH